MESLAFNVVARIDDLLYVDDLTKHSDEQLSSISKLGVMSHKNSPLPFSVPISGTPYKTPFATPSFSPAQAASPAKTTQRGFGIRKVLIDYLGIEARGGKEASNDIEKPEPVAYAELDKQTAQLREGVTSFPSPEQGSFA